MHNNYEKTHTVTLLMKGGERIYLSLTDVIFLSMIGSLCIILSVLLIYVAIKKFKNNKENSLSYEKESYAKSSTESNSVRIETDETY